MSKPINEQELKKEEGESSQSSTPIQQVDEQELNREELIEAEQMMPTEAELKENEEEKETPIGIVEPRRQSYYVAPRPKVRRYGSSGPWYDHEGKRVVGLRETIERGFKQVRDDMKKLGANLEKQLDTLHADVSNLGEAAAGSLLMSLVLLKYPNVGRPKQGTLPGPAKVPYPYRDPALQELASLCARYEGTRRCSPDELQIDWLMETDQQFCIVAEVCRSSGLLYNSAEFEAPSKTIRSPSSKLLYKLIQLERAARVMSKAGYTDENLFCLVVSPSFRQTSKNDPLLGTVIYHYETELYHLKALYHKRHVRYLAM